MLIHIFPESDSSPIALEGRLLALAFAVLAVGSVALALAPAALRSDWNAAGGRWQHFVLLPTWALAAWLIRRYALRELPERDPLLLPAGMLLAGWGALMVWRLLPGFGWRQTGWLLVASLALIGAVRAGPDLRWLSRYRYLWLSAGVVLTALTLFFGTHPSGSEPRLWLGCCGLFFQPSELLRLLLIVFVASYLSDRLGGSLDWERRGLLAVLVPLLVVWAISVGLLFVQRDLGTGSLFVALLAVLLYVATGRRTVLGVGLGLLVAGGAAAALTFEVVGRRLAAWTNPWIDPIGTGYQLIQSTMAVASGRVFGRGPGMGAPGFVPAAHTDFIYASVAEEWGLVGALALVALIAALVTRGLRIAAARADTFSVMLAAGLSLGLGLQSVLILGGVLRLLPLTGVTLPFVSYGGSSLVTQFVALGLLLRLSVAQRGRNRFGPALIRAGGGVLAALAVVALGTGWWALLRAPDILARTDNPRRAREARYSPRGRILDRNQETLAGVSGEVGGFERVYQESAAAPVIGFDSARFGQAGIEASLDPYLRGHEGYSAWTEWWHSFATGSPPPGLDVMLTLDRVLQERAMEAVSGQMGAAVVLDGSTGEVLALASSPSYEPSRLDESWSALTTREDAPLLNRATQASYQPGTALTPFLYAWAEGKGVRFGGPFVDLNSAVAVEGGELTCAQARELADSRDPEAALRAGCPAPSAAVGVDLGPESLREFVAAFELDRQPEIPLPQSTPWQGTVPTDTCGLKAFAVGQSSLTVTPLQLARAFASLGRGGVLPSVKLVVGVQTPGGEWLDVERGEGETRAVGPEAAAATVRSLDEEGRIEVSALALTGKEGLRVSYYLGSSPEQPGSPVVVLALEDGDPSIARTAGRELLRAASRRAED